MIKYIKRKDIDVEKYDDCIENSLQSRVYAFSWYLDIVADNWGVLVLDDYQAVMPLPWRKKYGIKYVTQPPFCQQLGIFSLKETRKEVQLQFIFAIPICFFKVNYQLNANNNLNIKGITYRDNYTLMLDNDFYMLLANCKKNRKRDYNKALKNKLKFNENLDEKLFFEFLDKTSVTYKITEKEIQVIRKIYSNIDLTKRVQIGVTYEDKLVSVLLGIKMNNKIVYLFPVNNHLSKKIGSATFLILELIKKYENTNIKLDFEGSMIKNVSNFYQSFGAEKETYFLYNKSILAKFLSNVKE